MEFHPNFWTTYVGSFPHQDADSLCQRIIGSVDVPAWPQLPRRTFRESIYVQYGSGIPGIVVNEVGERVYFDTTGDLSGPLERFYEHYLSGDLEAFAIPPEYSAGFYALLKALENAPGEWVKGQVIGPVSFGLTVVDQDRRASLYHEMLPDAIVKNMAMNARWQIRQLKTRRPNVIIFVDEPYMASFGSAYVSIDRAQVVTMLDEVFAAIHEEGALAGVHCCGNTDWSVLLGTQVDIVNLDAHGFTENLALYPDELAAFLGRGGRIAWGIVPNTEEIFQESHTSIARRLQQGVELICKKAAGRGVDLPVEQLNRQSLITTSCGLGSSSLEIAERALEVMKGLGEELRG